MPTRQGLFLTGATGQLGQYLLNDLLIRGHQVAVLARDSPTERATERLHRIIDSLSKRVGRALPTPVVLNGDLCQTGLGLTAADRNWLGRNCRAVIHSAASLSFRKTGADEPWRTNVDGTKSLLELCRSVGMLEWHHVSTAFVCGDRAGDIAEKDLDHGQSFHNDYEKTKFQAEKLIRAAADLHATIYRPSIIIGDSRTGYTSTFTGLYRFLELAAHLASDDFRSNERGSPLRLPLNGSEPWNLVPVDWVSSAIVQLLSKSQWHGQTFHLVSRSPVSTRMIRDVGTQVLKLRGIEFSNSEEIQHPSQKEKLFQNGIREYWPYLGGNPVFSFANTDKALPELPPPLIDQELLERVIRFAVNNRWGRGPMSAKPMKTHPGPTAPSACAEYFEHAFPRQANRSRLAREARLNLTVCFDVRGLDGGQWACQWIQGELVSVSRGLERSATVTFHTDTATFEAVINHLVTPQEAFFEQQIDITGDMESGLKLAVLFGQFLAEERSPIPESKRVINVLSTPA